MRDLAREALVDLVGFYCMAFDPMKPVSALQRDVGAMSIDAARLCQKPMVAIFQVGGDWVPRCPDHLMSGRHIYLEPVVRRRLNKLASAAA